MHSCQPSTTEVQHCREFIGLFLRTNSHGQNHKPRWTVRRARRPSATLLTPRPQDSGCPCGLREPVREMVGVLLAEAVAPVEKPVAAAPEPRVDETKIARSFCRVFAARARAAESHRARAQAFGAWRRGTECARPAPASPAPPAAPASATPRKRRRTPLKARDVNAENILPADANFPSLSAGKARASAGGKARPSPPPAAGAPPSGGAHRSARSARCARSPPPAGTPHPYVPPPPPAVASPRRVCWSPAAVAATPEKAAVRRDLFSCDAADENDTASPAKGDAPPWAASPRAGEATPADATSPVVSPAPRVSPAMPTELMTGPFTGSLGRLLDAPKTGRSYADADAVPTPGAAREAPKVVTPVASKLEQWRGKYRAGYARPAAAAPAKATARPFRFARPATGWRCNLCFAANAADAATCDLCREAKPAAS